MGIVNRDGALWMATGIDNSGLEQDAAEAESIIDGIGTQTEKAGSRMQKSFQSMKNTIASARETMSVLEKTISTLNSKIDSNTTSSSADTKKVKELESALADLKSKYDNLNKSVPQSGTQIKQSAQDAKQAASDYNSLVKSINTAWKTLGIGVSLAGVKSLTSEIVNVRGEIQMLESSFEVLLGGKGVSGFMSEMKQFAVDSPLSMNGVANAAQTLLGFGITAEKVMPTIKQIGDISMGNEERFKSLSLAFAQMSATGKLMGQDLLQMINAGFNPLQTISEKTGKSIGELKKDMENGAISSEMVAQAFASATEKGGKFYGMTQKQAEGIRGLQAQLEGGLQEAFNEIGKSQEGLIAGGYKITTMLVENYNKVGKALVGLIATYGVYRTALILNIIATQSLATTQFQLGVVLARVQKIWQGLTATMSVNSYVLMATAITGLIVTVWALNDATTTQESAQSKLNSIVDETKTKKEELRGKSNELISVINSETKSVKEQILAYKELQKEHQKYLGNKSFEDFKKLSPKEQQQLIDKSSFELSDTIINESLTKYKRLQEALNNRSGGFRGINEGVDLLKEISKELGIEGASSEYIRKTLSETITLLEKQKEVRDEAGKEAEKGPKAIQDQIFSTKKSVQDLRKELKDLQKGVIPAASKEDAGFDFAKTIEEKTKSLKDAENKLNLLLHGKSTSEIEKGNKTGESAAEKALKLAQKQADARIKGYNDLEKADLDHYNATLENQQNSLNLLEDGFEKEQQLLDINLDKSVLAAQKRVRDLIEKQQQAEEDAWKAGGSKGVFSPSTQSSDDLFKINPGANTEYNKSLKIAKLTYDKGMGDLYKSQLAMYQDYSAKRVAIEKRFNDDILSLQKSREQAEKGGNDDLADQLTRSIAQATKEKGESLVNLDFEQLKKSPEYVRAFENLKNTSTETLNSLLQQLEQAKQAAVQVLTPDQLKEYTSTIESIMNELISRDIFGAIAELKREVADADKELIEAERQYNAVVRGSDTSMTEIQALTKLNAAKDKSVKKTNQLKDAEDKLSDQIQQLGKEIENVGNAIGGTVGQIISLMGSITSTVTFAVNGVKAVAQAGAAAISTVEKASVILAIIGAALQIATKIASLFAADYSEYEKAKGVYESYIAVLDKVIEKQKELVETMTGENARNSYEYALELIKKQEAASRELGLIFAGSGASAGSRSKGRRAWDRVSEQGWNELAQWNKELSGMAYEVKNVDWLFGQSVEELQRLQEVAPTFWAQLGDDIGGYLQAIIDSGEASKELMEYYKESITQISFDSFRDSFLDTLSDMNSSSEDFADNFEKYLQKAILNGLLKEKYDSQIRALYDSFSKYGEDGIDQSEYDLLQKQKDDLVDSMLSEREKLKDLFDWDSSDNRSSEAKGFTSVSQDSADYLTGLWTISVEHTRNINENVSGLHELAKGIASSFKELRNDTNSILQSVLNIEENTRELYFMREDISSMRQDISSMVLHGLILKK